MMKKISLLSLFYFLTLCNALMAADDIAGFWKTINEDSGKAESVIAVYQYQGMYYGRIIGSYNAEGKMDDTIYHPIDRAPGVEGDPFYSGLDIIWNLRDRGSVFKGKIMDPQEGKVYNAEVWVEDGNLVVRGKVFIFGRSQTWPPALESDFPPGFEKPDVSKFIPDIHQVK